MKKTYMKPQMEAIEIKLQGMIAASGDPKYGGGYGGGGGSDAPQMPDFTDFDDFQNQFDFTNVGIKLW